MSCDYETEDAHRRRLEMFLGFTSSPYNCYGFPLHVRDVSSWISKLLQRPGQLLSLWEPTQDFLKFIFNFVWVGSAFYLFNTILSPSFTFNLFHFTLCHYFSSFCVSTIQFTCVSLGFHLVVQHFGKPCEPLRLWTDVRGPCPLHRLMLPRQACEKLKRQKQDEVHFENSRQQVDQMFRRQTLPHQEKSSSFLQGTLRGWVRLLLLLKGTWTDCLYWGCGEQSKFIFQDAFDLLIIK